MNSLIYQRLTEYDLAFPFPFSPQYVLLGSQLDYKKVRDLGINRTVIAHE